MMAIRLRRLRLAASAGFGVLLWLALPPGWRQTTRLLVAWDAALLLYLGLIAQMAVRSTHEHIRRRAAVEDAGRSAVLLFTTLAALASLAAIVAELAQARALSGRAEWLPIELAGITVLLSWSFMQVMFALHYAHEYYTRGGLQFPHEEMPDYWDFAYHAFVIGTSAATADINITSRAMRRLAGLHCVVAFFFNTTILALMVNIGAGLF